MVRLFYVVWFLFFHVYRLWLHHRQQLDSISVVETTNLQRKSNDVGWEFGMLINPNNLDKMKCKLSYGERSFQEESID